MRKLKFQRQSVGLALIGVLILSMSLLGVLDSPAKAEDFAGEIVMGYDGALTGPWSISAAHYIDAVQDYWKVHNQRITVDGKSYKINLIIRDHKGDVSVSVSNFHHFASKGAVIVRTEGTPFGMAMKPLAEKMHIPVSIGGYSKGLISPPSKYVYFAQPSYAGAFTAGIKWMKENVWKGSGKMRLGMMLWDNSYGRSVHDDDVYAYFKEDLGIEVLPTIFFPTALKDFTAHLLRLKDQGADVIYMQALVSQYAMVCKDAKRLGLTPGIKLITTYWSLNEIFPKLGGDAANGAYGLWHLYVADEDDNPSNPEVVKIHDAMEKYRGNRYFSTGYIVGWMSQHIQAHQLEEAIKKYGFPITGEDVANASSEMGSWDWGLSRSFSGYRGGDRLGWHEHRVFQMKEGKRRVASDWIPTPAPFLKRAPWLVGK